MFRDSAALHDYFEVLTRKRNKRPRKRNERPRKTERGFRDQERGMRDPERVMRNPEREMRGTERGYYRGWPNLQFVATCAQSTN